MWTALDNCGQHLAGASPAPPRALLERLRYVITPTCPAGHGLYKKTLTDHGPLYPPQLAAALRDSAAAIGLVLGVLSLSPGRYVAPIRLSWPAHSRSRSTNFWTLPVEVFGSGPSSTASGHL